MIIERMSKQEIEAEIEADYPNVLAYANKISSKFRRTVLNAKEFPVIMDKIYTSKRYNKWILILYADSKKDVKGITRLALICYYNTKEGYYAVFISPPFICIFAPHVFVRYSERKGVNLYGVNRIVHFFRNNLYFGMHFEYFTHRDGSRRGIMAGVSNDGVVLGIKITDTILLAKTFVTRKMEREDQANKFASSEIFAKELIARAARLGVHYSKLEDNMKYRQDINWRFSEIKKLR